jgi:TRAP-type C4-dicarboxylate transport system substrate-binding protein
MNLNLFNALSPADQKVLLDAAKAGSDLERKLNDELVPKWSAELRQKGMKIVPVADKRPSWTICARSGPSSSDRSGRT